MPQDYTDIITIELVPSPVDDDTLDVFEVHSFGLG